MICYKDRTFCITPGCTKEHALTDEARKAAQAAGLPISTAYLCGMERVEPPQDGHNRRLSGVLTVKRDALDYQRGCAVADATVKRDLCDECMDAIETAINDAAEERRSRAGGSR